jgi:rubrerythrin
MAAFSKPIFTEVDIATMPLEEPTSLSNSTYDEEELTSSSAMPAVPMPSTAQFASSAFSIETSAIHDFIKDSSSLIIFNQSMDHQHSSAPYDGDTVWYCSNCSNGPMGTWYNACPSCGHQQCYQCTVEHV